jgi:hypothetical protein
MLSSLSNDKIDPLSKILKIIGAGDAESMRDRLELFGPIRFLEVTLIHIQISDLMIIII